MIDYIVLMSLMERREKLYTLQRSFCHRLYYANHPFLCISSTYEFRLTPFALLAFRISSFRLCACARLLQSPLLTDTHTRNNGRGSRLTKDDDRGPVRLIGNRYDLFLIRCRSECTIILLRYYYAHATK